MYTHNCFRHLRSVIRNCVTQLLL